MAVQAKRFRTKLTVRRTTPRADADNLARTFATPGERLRAVRLLRGLFTAADAAHALKVPAVTYRAHERGIRTLEPEVARRYAKFLDVNPDVILYGDDAVVFPDAVGRRVFYSFDVAGVVNRFGRVEALTEGVVVPDVKAERFMPDDRLSMVLVDADELAPAYRRGDMVFHDPLLRIADLPDLDRCDAVVRVNTSRVFLAFITRAKRDWIVEVPGQSEPRTLPIFAAGRVRWVRRGISPG
jgi:hypothetical protein